jgi:hypothetical protein
VRGFALFLSCSIHVSGVHIENGHTYERNRINVMLDAKPGLRLVVSTNGSRINPPDSTNTRKI